MTERTHISKEQYRGIVKEMERDAQRSERQRQVERAHGQDLPALLQTLHRKHDGNASAVLREMNERIQGSSVSRPTLYDWLDQYEVRKTDGDSGNENPAAKTPQGVPDSAHSISDPSECSGRVVEGERGGLYCVPEGEDEGEGGGGSDLADAADEQGNLAVADVEAGDEVEINGDVVTVDATASDGNGDVVQFSKGGEDFFLYDDLVEIKVPGFDEGDSDGGDGGDGGEGGEGTPEDTGGIQEGDTFEFGGEQATVVGYDETTGTVAYETESGEQDLTTEESVTGEDRGPDMEPRDQDLTEQAGLQYANTDGLSDEQYQQVAEGIEQYQEQYDLADSAVMGVTTSPPEGSDAGPSAVASYSASSRDLYVNPDQFDSQAAQDSYESGFSATPGGEGTVNHEMAHAEHFDAVIGDPDMDLTEMQEADLPDDLADTVEQEVSTYAASSPVEMVAEVKAGVLHGESYSDEVMEAYRDFNGPEI